MCVSLNTQLWGGVRSVTDTWKFVRIRLALVVALVSVPSWGAAISLRYDRPDGCPDEAALRQLVASRLGADPFVDGAASVVSVRVTSGAPMQAEVVLESPGSPTRRKNLTGATCDELLQSVAVTVAIAVDPIVKKPEAPPPVVVKVVEPPPPPVTSPPPPPSLNWSVSAGASANIGLSTGVQPTLRIEGRARGTLFSLGVEGRFAWPVTGTLTQGALTTSAFLGAIVPCLHWKWFAGCGDVSLGGLRLEGAALASARAATVFHASLGLRVLFNVPVTDHFGIGAMLEGQVPLTRATALVGTERVWTVPPAGAGLGLWLSFLL
jgi:hypothetical protein